METLLPMLFMQNIFALCWIYVGSTRVRQGPSFPVFIESRQGPGFPVFVGSHKGSAFPVFVGSRQGSGFPVFVGSRVPVFRYAMLSGNWIIFFDKIRAISLVLALLFRNYTQIFIFKNQTFNILFKENSEKSWGIYS